MTRVGKHKLPESIYDFYAKDSRDGEARGPFHTRARARKAAQEWRHTLNSWQRCCISVYHELSERKIATFLDEGATP
jgi:hypothetical protein